MLKFYSLFFFIVLSFSTVGQGVAPLGQSPPGLKWKQIQTKHFRIIFPIEITADAQRIANALDNAYHDVAASLKSYPRKIPVVMQNQTVDNNAFVSSEGRRAEFFSTPPQNPNNMGLNNWYDELSLHEYRHVVQMDQTRTGWGKYIFYLFGNSGTSVMQGLTNPWWFWEGDAVGCETVLGYGGRGRIPSFDLTFRTQLLCRGAFPYLKSACGSLKNAIPNHYLMGYLMTTYAKNHYGADVWSRVLTKTYSKPPFPFSFSKSIKKVTGLNAQELYDSMTHELKIMWGKQADSIKETPAVQMHSPKEKVFINYKFPQYMPDGSIVAQKSGLETGSFLAYKSSIIDQSLFVRLTREGKEEKIRMSGVLDDNAVISSFNNKVVWTEYTYDPRWGARNYTVIKILDAETKKITQLTRRSRYHAPCFSPDGKTIAAVETTTGNKFFLVLLNAETGQVIKKFDNPTNQQFLQPHFTSDGKNILLIYQVPGFKSIVKVNIETGSVTTILNPVPENISAPVDFNNFVLYNSPQTGIDNIYATDTLTGKTYQVTSRKFGAFNPCPSADGKKICFQDFTPDGFRIVEIPANPEEWPLVNYNQDTGKKVNYYKPFAGHEAGNILTRIPDSVYPASPYKRIRHAIKIFGWGIDPVTNLPKMSLGIRSADMLSTTTMQAGIRYDNDEKEFTKYFMMGYQGLYPQFFFTFLDGRRKTIFPESEGSVNANGISYDRIHYRSYTVGTQLPLNLSSGPYIRKTNIIIQGGYTDFSVLNRRINDNGYNKTKLGNFYSVSYDLSYEMRLRQSMRDVGPRFGTILQFSYRNTPVKSFFQAKQKAADAVLFLPGFFKHHSVRFRYNRQQDDSSTYHFENRFDFVRNKRNQLFNDWSLWSVDYKFTLGYPEFPLLNGFLYFQRIKANLFAEYGVGKFSFANVNEKDRFYTNLGVELTSDVNLLRFLVPFDAGIRISYLTQTRSVLFGIMVKAPNIF